MRPTHVLEGDLLYSKSTDLMLISSFLKTKNKKKNLHGNIQMCLTKYPSIVAQSSWHTKLIIIPCQSFKNYIFGRNYKERQISSFMKSESPNLPSHNMNYFYHICAYLFVYLKNKLLFSLHRWGKGEGPLKALVSPLILAHFLSTYFINNEETCQ